MSLWLENKFLCGSDGVNHMHAPQTEANQSFFSLAVQLAADFLKAKIISSENDEVALVLYGTVRGFPAIHCICTSFNPAKRRRVAHCLRKAFR